MYPSSSQKKHWTFRSEQELIELRMKSNQEFIRAHGSHLDVSFQISCLHLKFKFLFRAKRRNRSSWTRTKRVFCWDSTSFSWRSSARDLSHRCQETRSEQLFIISSVFTSTKLRWIFTAKRFCKWRWERPLSIPHVSLLSVLLAFISRARSRNSTFRSSNSWQTSKGTGTRQWISFSAMSCCWCKSSTTIWQFTIHSGLSRDSLLI